MTYLCLIGEQPLPNLLPVLHLKPSRVVFFFSERTKTISTRLSKLVEEELGIVCSYILLHDPHRIDACALQFREYSELYPNAVYNATGGTKPMAMAALAVAAEFRQDVHYVVTDSSGMSIHTYSFDQGTRAVMSYDGSAPISNVLTADLYLRAHFSGYELLGYSKKESGNLSSGGFFEKAVATTLSEAGYEVLVGVMPTGFARQIEIDLVVRNKNNVAILELKTKWKTNSDPSTQLLDPAKRALEQVNLASEEFGPFSHRLVVTSSELPKGLQKAGQKLRISCVHTEYLGKHLTDEGRTQLLNAVSNLIGTP